MSDNKILAAEILVKVFKLKTIVENQQNQLNILQNENQMLKKQLLEQTKNYEKLKDTNKIIKIAEGLNLSDLNKAELTYSLNQYIKQIDECIKLLSD